MDMNVGVGMETLSTEERARNVSDLLRVLMDINEINGGGADSAEKMKVHVKNFEAALFAKCSTKKEYLNSMKEKITTMCNTRDSRKKASMAAKQQVRTQQPQQMNNNNNNNSNNNNSNNFAANNGNNSNSNTSNNFVTNSSNANSRAFLNQQAQVRQQAAQQLKDRQQQAGNNGANQQQQRHQLTPQQQMLINQMKVAPIPRELLQKIPNVPPGVNTWQQITSLAQNKHFTQQEMLIAKEVYKVHQQLLYKTKMQQQQAQQAQQMKQQEVQSQMQAQKQQQVPQTQQQPNNGSQQGKPPQQGTGQQPQQPQRVNRSGDMPNVLGQINQIFTPEEQRSLLQEAMEACKHFQKTQYGANMTDATRQNFVRKYINQKALKKIQTIKMSQAAAGGSSSSTGANGNVNVNNNNNNNNNANMNNVQNSQMSRNSSLNGNNNNNNFNNGQNLQTVPVSQMNGNLKQPPNQMANQMPSQQQNQQQQQNQNQNQRAQTQMRNQQNTNTQPQNQQKMPQSANNNNNNNNNSQGNSGLQMFQPTQHDLEMVRKISAAAARIPLRLTDLTNSISPQERDEIKRKLQMNQQLFAQVSNYAPQVYVFTKSEPFLKEVLQLRIFVKEILEKCSRGIYVVKLDTVDKLVMKYQKYWESMKLQILRRQQMIEQHKRQQSQQQPQQQSQPQQQRLSNSGQQPNNQGNNFPNNNNNNNNTGNIISPQRSNTGLSQQQQQQQMSQSQQQWSQNQPQLPPQSGSNGNNFSPQGYNNIPKNASSTVNTPQTQPPNLNDMNKVKSQMNANGVTPDLTKNPSSQSGISPKREGSASHSRAKSVSKKSSPVMTTGVSSSGLSKSGTPKHMGTSPNLVGRAMSTSQHSPSPLTGDSTNTSTTIPTDMPFKKEVETLESLNIKKGEIISRYKHRQEFFRSSPIDMFLGTLADSLGIKDEDVEAPLLKFTKHTVDTVNGTGKKKMTKVQQRIRDRDLVDVKIIDDQKLIMKSKAMKEGRLYAIKLNAVAGVFKSAIRGGNNDMVNSMVNESESSTLLPHKVENKKRKFDKIDSGFSASLHSDEIISPSTGSLMGESKRIKLDSPEDLFADSNDDSKKNNVIPNNNNSKPIEPNNNDPLGNVWNWDFWSNIQG